VRCYQCNTPKSENAQEVVSQLDEGEKPTVELIVRGLDPNTTDNTVWILYKILTKRFSMSSHLLEK
jgi:hypothetical protein